MPYNKLNLQKGDTFTAEHLEHIEDGIVGSFATLYPTIEIGSLNTEGEFSSSYWGMKRYRTTKYIKTLSSTIKITSNIPCSYNLFEYDKNFVYISQSGLMNDFLEKDTAKELTLQENTAYIRVVFCNNTDKDVEMNKPIIKMENIEDREYFSPRPLDDGYQKIIVPVNVMNLTCCEQEDWAVQDSLNIKVDYGMLALPKTYSNTGKPTRLIIYCHGSGGHYSASSTRINTSDCKPEYWLAEGYAVMDMDGYPYDDTTAHYWCPEAVQCYEQGYLWAIQNYNLCTDGIFLGGRSMGGGTIFSILHSSIIPVIAACPLAAVTNQLWHWGKTSKATKTHIANSWHFEGDRPEFSSGSQSGGAAPSEEEWDYLKQNFDKLMQYSPFMMGIRNLTDIDAYFDAHKIDVWNQYSSEPEMEVHKNLIYEVPCPVKFFGCYEDTSVMTGRNAEVMQQMIINGGQICEVRKVSSPTGGHHFEENDPQAYTTVTTIYGETMSAQIMYIEMLQFWRRYEKFI